MVSELSRKLSAFTVNIDGVRESALCLAALGAATNEFPLEIGPGEYGIIFNHRDNFYSFKLAVTDSSLQVTENGPAFVTPEINVFWQYPENSFAYLCRFTPEIRWMCEDFEQLLNDSLAINSFTFPDHGTKPYPSEEEQYDNATYYRYPEESVFLEAGRMLEAYTDSVVSRQEGAFFSVISWKNQGFRSWTDVGE